MQYGALVGMQAPAQSSVPPRPARRDAWPLPALAAWSLGWALYAGLRACDAPDAVALAAGVASGAVLSVLGGSRSRRFIIALGFPLSLLATGGAAGLPAWAWLLPLALLALAYPLNAWRDAPFFPTPARALDGLAALAPLPGGASILDAGCGLGHGLAALRRAYPAARLSGTEWSWPLALMARWRALPMTAEVRRGDMWADDWSGHDLVYLFQRPESLPRAVAKARSELKPGCWLASLEFEAAELTPQAVLTCDDGRPVWLYRTPFASRNESAAAAPSSSRPKRR